MSTMLHLSPRARFHLHHPAEDLFPRFFDGAPTNEASQPASPWLPATEGWIENGTYVIQFALPGVDPKEVKVSLMDSLLTVKGESKANPDVTGKDYFVRELVYGPF